MRSFLERPTPVITVYFCNIIIFSEEAPAEQCPIEAPLNFTYHTSGGSCSSRISSITRCSDWNRLSFRYQACPENPTKEASVSEVECIASWHSLGHTFFAARVGNRRGESYRCFITKFTLNAIFPTTCAAIRMVGYDIRGNRSSRESGTSFRMEIGFLRIKLETTPSGHAWKAVSTPSLPPSERIFDEFHRRAHNMVQVNFGQVSLNEYEDCSEMTVETRDTLVLNGAQYSRHRIDNNSDLYSCAASFEATNGEHYLVVRDELSAQYQCMKINTDNDVVMKLYDHVACDPVSTGAALPSLVVNISSTERCESSLLAGFLYYSRGSTAIQSPFILAIFLFIFDILL
ncbi:unnamed protein product [Nippostrongylus brasiliensis]|uniref:ZP domain-containing protein n=1 Tax=Nippostrongylus brasiliensis TaxID=27835 RepID=A0A0N4XY52_NIPBR|nr:unnamed protein product [Nippostrongylus brasiliensis]